ncbi:MULTISPECIES: recombinase family protein [Pseudomonas]|uniref:recombinase family protein n=1 Tax=Pseudomonas TaxID=286 RepID=UPI001F346324|nr:recombinase family protein [Pseudomonas juntendi]MCO7054513.1 recombinase family protein [Pseudomonas juntendi]UJM12383.1 recombinase family protein [Pseudomonas juntendi]UXA38619.1 recombinase family protein [Pseudomonas juntendi]
METLKIDRSKPLAIAYVRWSSTVQGGDDKDSYDRQTSPLEFFTSSTGVPVVETIIDPGQSAFTGENSKKGKLKGILDRIESGEIRKGDFLVVESIDRITRMRVLDGVALIQDGILKKGVKLYTTTDNKTYSYEDPEKDFENLLMISLIAKRANEESEIKSKRRRSAWNKAKTKATDGVPFNAHNPPYGLRYDPEENRFEIVEDEAIEIKKIFEGLKYEGVSNTLKKVNLTSKRKWSRKTVHLMLTSRYPIGTLMSQKRDGKTKVFERYIENYYPAILTHKEFQDALQAMKQRGKVKDYGRNTEGYLNIFKHCVKCAVCGQSLMFEKSMNKKGIKYGYFHCWTRKETLSHCDVPRFRFDFAFGTLLQLVKQLTCEEDFDAHPWASEMPADYDSTLADDEINIENFGNQFLSLFSKSTATEAVKTEFYKAENELAKAKSIYENLTASFSQFSDGRIPSFFIKQMSDAEQAYENAKADVDALSVQIDNAESSLEIYSYKDIIDLYSSDEGRLKLNYFFKSNGFKFIFNYEAKTRTLFMTVRDKADAEIYRVGKKFTLHNPLKEFGIDNLNEQMNSVLKV